MKCFFTILIIAFQFTLLNAQDDCLHFNKYMKRGDFEMERDSFTKAFESYSIAQVHCPDSAEIARNKILMLFKKVEKLRVKAVAAEHSTKQALEQLKKEEAKSKRAFEELKHAKKATELALDKSQKLVNALFFYDGKYAMAIGGDIEKNFYYFINKDGEIVNKFKRWDYTEPFDKFGFAKVMTETSDDIWAEQLMDTLGNMYSVAYTMNDVKANTQVLYLDGRKLTTLDLSPIKESNIEVLVLGSNFLTDLPMEIEKLISLKHLELSRNQFNALPAKIGQLSNLKILNIRRNKLTDLPDEIGQLKNLEILDLRKNAFSQNAQNRIRKLLPNCKILF